MKWILIVLDLKNNLLILMKWRNNIDLFNDPGSSWSKGNTDKRQILKFIHFQKSKIHLIMIIIEVFF